MRIKEIRIRNFKNLIDFEIKNLKKINYIIGSSGAGKSTVWELSTILSRGLYSGRAVMNFGDLQTIISKDSLLEMVVEDTEGQAFSNTWELFAHGQYNLGADTSGVTRSIDIQYFSNEAKERNFKTTLKNRISQSMPATENSGPVKQALTIVADNFEGSTLHHLSHVTPGDINDEPILLRGPERGDVMSTWALSGAHSSVTSLLAVLVNNLGTVVVIEEPELGMHVKVQKELHRLIQEATKDSKDVQVIVITHSPFVLAGIDDDDHETNTFLMENGQCLKPEGYSAKGSRFLAAKLTGVSIADIMPEKVILSEGSLALLLDVVNDRFYYKPYLFDSLKSHNGNESSSDESLLGYEDVFKVYENRFNFYTGNEMVAVIDKPNAAQEKSKFKGRVNKAANEKGFSLITLGTTTLESKYSQLKDLPEELSALVNDAEAQKHRKKELAQAVGDNISKDQFESVFEELMVLFDPKF